MSESRPPLSQILEELHEALDASGDLADDAREELRSAAADIQETLDRAGDDASGSLRRRLNAALESFEESHPRLTEVVGRMADALSDMGI